MTEGTELRDRVLRAFDERLLPDGLSRRKAAYEWWRDDSPERATYFHLNFGRLESPLSITPSLGVRHMQIERAKVAAGLPRGVTFWQPLTALTGSVYAATAIDGGDSAVRQIWADWCDQGQEFLAEAADLALMTARLESDDPRQWPCAGRSARARLLPLALAYTGRLEEAFERLPALRQDMDANDQFLPAFSVFESWFRSEYSK